MVEGTFIRTYLDECKKLMRDLKDVNEAWLDEKQCIMLLVSLQDSFKHFNDSLL